MTRIQAPQTEGWVAEDADQNGAADESARKFRD